jgi:outer membrane protein
MGKVKGLLAIGLLAGMVSSYAVDLIGGITVEGGPQINRYRGWLQYKGTKVDLKEDLHLKDKTQYFVSIDIKKGASLSLIPLIPNLKITYLKSETDGVGTIGKSITIGGITFTARDKIYSKVKFNQYDITLYYTPIDVGAANFSWGFGAKIIDFYEKTVSLNFPGLNQEKSATIPVPYLYLKVGLDLPYIHASAEGKGLKIGGSYFYDWAAKAGVGYSFVHVLKLSFDVGYRYQRYRIDDVSDISSDIRLKGSFAALSLTFSF